MMNLKVSPNGSCPGLADGTWPAQVHSALGSQATVLDHFGDASMEHGGKVFQCPGMFVISTRETPVVIGRLLGGHFDVAPSMGE